VQLERTWHGRIACRIASTPSRIGSQHRYLWVELHHHAETRIEHTSKNERRTGENSSILNGASRVPLDDDWLIKRKIRKIVSSPELSSTT